MTHPLALFRYCPKCGSSEFYIHDEKSKQCQQCQFVYYFNSSTAVVAIITTENNELLVCRRAKDPEKGTLDLPGGFVDLSETAEEAVIREVKEETNLQVSSLQFLFSYPNIYHYSGFVIHTVDLFFSCNVKNFSQLNAFDDISESFFLSKDQINISEFGLVSIKAGIEKWLAMGYK